MGALYAEMAEEVPPQYSSPFITTAKGKMNEVVSACASYYRSNGEDGFEEFARKRLAQAGEEVRRYMRRNPY